MGGPTYLTPGSQLAKDYLCAFDKCPYCDDFPVDHKIWLLIREDLSQWQDLVDSEVYKAICSETFSLPDWEQPEFDMARDLREFRYVQCPKGEGFFVSSYSPLELLHNDSWETNILASKTYQKKMEADLYEEYLMIGHPPASSN